MTLLRFSHPTATSRPSAPDSTGGAVLAFPAGREARPLRVLVVSESFLPQVNGVTNSVRRVLEHLAAEGHEAELVAPTGPPSYAGFPVTRTRGASLPFYKDFRLGFETRRRLREIMLRFRPDVVHVASPATLGHQACRAAAELGIPAVAIYQTDLIGFAERYDVAGGATAAAWLTRRIHSSAALTLAPSTASMRQLEALAVPDVVHWPRGVDLAAYSPGNRCEDLRRRLAPGGELLVGYVGRMAAEKELDLLRGLSNMPGIRLVMVGDGPEKRRLRELMPQAAFLGLLHGEELARAHASFDVFVHTGRHETFCQSAQEALASGVPVVAPRAGGPLDLVAEGRTGFLFEPGEAAQVGAFVRLLGHDEQLRARMAAAARPSVEGRSWAAVNAALVGHYRRVSGQPALRRLSELAG
ncbi:glycosyltransferase family 4 protein [Nocardioides pacificus]